MVGVKWRHGGRSRDSVDCAGLLVVVARELGYPVVDVQGGYSRRPDGRLLSMLQLNLDPVDPDDLLMTADVLAYWTNPDFRVVSHVGIRTECGGLIHAKAQARKVVEITDASEWESRRVCALRWRGVS